MPLFPLLERVTAGDREAGPAQKSSGQRGKRPGETVRIIGPPEGTADKSAHDGEHGERQHAHCLAIQASAVRRDPAPPTKRQRAKQEQQYA